MRSFALLPLALVSTSGCVVGLEPTPPDPAPATGQTTTDWPSFGHDQANSRNNPLETRITRSTVASSDEVWSVPMAGCTSTPAVVDGVVYVGDWEGNLRAIALGDGSERWTTAVSGSALDPSPLVHGGRIFIGDGAGDMHAVDQATGAPVWSVVLDEHPSAHIFSSAAAADDLVIVGVASIELVGVKDDYTFRGSLVGLDAATGDERWRVYMTEDDETSGAGVSVWSSAAIDPERHLALIGTGQTYEPPASLLADGIVAVDYQTGEIVWSRQFTADDVYTIFQPPPQGPDADVGAAPNLFSADGRDLVAVGDKAGVFSALDRDTGETVWAVQLTEGSHLGGVMNAGAFASGVLYTNSNTFTTEFGADVLDNPDPLNTNTTFALDARDGTVLWSVDEPYPSVGGVSTAAGVVYHASVDGSFHAHDADSGYLLWARKPGSSLASGSSVVDGHLLVSHGFRFFTGSDEIAGGLTAFAPASL